MSNLEFESTADSDVATTERGGIYSLPVVGRPLSEARGFYDEMRPTEEDSFGVTLGKNAVRFGTVAAATGVAAMVCL